MMEIILYIISAIIFFILHCFSKGSTHVSDKILSVVSLITSLLSSMATAFQIAIVFHLV